MWEQQIDQETVFFRKQALCETMSGNPVPVLTITAKPKIYNKEQVEQLSKSLTDIINEPRLEKTCLQGF